LSAVSRKYSAPFSATSHTRETLQASLDEDFGKQPKIMESTKSNRGFKYAMIALLLFVVIIISNMAMFHSGSDIFPMIVGFVFLMIVIIAIVGLVYSLKGIREPNNLKKFVGLLINCGFIALFIFVIIANIMDIKRALE